MLRVLHIVPNMHAAGLETLIMNMYRSIDRTKVQFDFLVHYTERFFYDDEIEQLGGKIHRLSFRNDGSLVKYLKDLDQFFKENKYEIVHGHMESTACFYLYMANKYDVPVRIVHSHNTSTERTLKGILKRHILKYSTLFANHYFACGELAGKYLYKDRAFTIVHNAVSFEKFRPDLIVRDKMRKKLDIEGNLVIGHIGRFNTQKNHKFLIDVFEKVMLKHPQSKLVLVGEGELEDEVRDLVIKKNLVNNVIFLGTRKDINSIYNMIDVFVLPSLFEGLPVVGVECQAAGCRAILSDKITDEIKLTSYIESCPIEGAEAVDKWVDGIVNNNHNESEIDYKLMRDKLVNAGYEINQEAANLVSKYKQLLE